MAFVSMIISLGVVYVGVELAGISLNYDFSLLISNNSFLIPAMLILSILVGALAGIYPSFVLSSIKSVSILRGRFQTSSDGIWLRKTLVVLQFVAAIGMICTTLIVSRQIDYIKNKHLGFEKDQIINININDSGLSERMENYRNKIQENPSVLNTSYSNNMPGRTFGRGGVNVEGGDQDEPWIVSVMSMDERFLETMEINLACGRKYGEIDGSDEDDAIIINQAMMESLGWTEAVGQKLVFGSGENSSTRTVVGLIEDFHFSNMRHKIEPLMIYYNPGPNSNFNVKVNPENVRATLDYLEAEWSAMFPNYPFDYQFFDQEFNEIYASDEFFANLVSTFTWLSIVLSSLGLFGLSFFMVEQRKKEIGVRKVLGSTIQQIVTLLMGEFVILIIVANVVAWPIAYLFVDRWISDFQYRIDLLNIQNLSIYVMAGIGALLIAMIAVSYKSINAALSNPINSLRDE